VQLLHVVVVALHQIGRRRGGRLREVRIETGTVVVVALKNEENNNILTRPIERWMTRSKASNKLWTGIENTTQKVRFQDICVTFSSKVTSNSICSAERITFLPGATESMLKLTSFTRVQSFGGKNLRLV
jgi:hypothetical protein